MATSTTSGWLMATMLCLAAATLVAGDMSGVTDVLENVDFMEFTSFAGVVEGQRSLLQASPATPSYSPRPSPKPCTLGDRPNSNTYTVRMVGRANWGYGRDLMQRATAAVYRSSVYASVARNLKITVTAGPRQIPLRGRNTWTYTVLVPVPRCTGRKESLRNALKNAIKNSTNGSRLLKFAAFDR